MEKPTVKLQSFLAHAGLGSRRKMEEAIQSGKVTVNGQQAQIGLRVTGAEEISFEGKNVSSKGEQLRYFLVNKPMGVVSTTSDELGRPTVLSLLPSIKERLYPVGRLDIETEGLLLLTNDGELANRLTHPRYAVPKTYRVTVEGQPTDKAIEHLQRGVKLKEGYTNPATIEYLKEVATNTQFDITITQGWNQQVRRMCERVGYPVIKLVRIAFGPFLLDHLREKRWIELTPEEVAAKFNV